MTDLVERLRARRMHSNAFPTWITSEPDQDCTEAASEIVRQRVRVEILLRGITDARCIIDPIWRERMGAESVREYVQRGLRCIDSAVTDCQFTAEKEPR